MRPRTALAEISGECNAAIAGVSLRETDSSDPGTAIEVDKGGEIGVAMASPVGFAAHSVWLEFAGIRWEVSSEKDTGEFEWVKLIDVDDYALFGVGLYKVVGEATLTDGSKCTGAALIDVQGNPLSTVLGITAAAAALGGGAAVVLSTLVSYGEGVRARRRVRRWLAEQAGHIERGQLAVDMGAFRRAVGRLAVFPVWLVAAIPGLLFAGALAGGSAPGGAATGGLRLPRSSFRPKVPLVGSLGGLLLGEGIVVLLQQYGVEPLTRSGALGGALAGLFLAIALTTSVRLWSNLETNRGIAAAEARINEAIERRLAAVAGQVPRAQDPGQEMPPTATGGGEPRA